MKYKLSGCFINFSCLFLWMSKQVFKLPSYKDYQWDDANYSSWFVNEKGKMFYLYYKDKSFRSWLPMENVNIYRYFTNIEIRRDRWGYYKIVHCSDGAQIWYRTKL
jgi:hypothetical protein